MPEDYVVRTAPAIEGSDIELDYRVAPHYQEMYDAAAAEGCYLTPYSGYRRYSTQDSNYNNKTAYYEAQGFTHEEALALAARVIMPPGSSEHNLGLCMDIYGTYDNWYTTREYAWLMEHAQDYGFILRYPREKQVETQVEFEPWHWRYVGVENAKLIKESGLCLEEFLNSPIYDAAG
nr:M15 family metallopeptidase [Clostridiales bacterium]